MTVTGKIQKFRMREISIEEAGLTGHVEPQRCGSADQIAASRARLLRAKHKCRKHKGSRSSPLILSSRALFYY
jgi:hypothetical protein